MKIKDAIIILGPGKSGTTLLYNILSLHRRLFWVSSYLIKFPHLPQLSLLNNIQNLASLEKFTRNKKKFPRPAETLHYWSCFIKGFHLNLSRFDPDEINEARKAVGRISKFQKGERFITKLTGPSRAGFIDQIFEDPYIIWMDRDPKAVVTSFYRYKWRYKNKPEEFKRKATIDLLKEYSDYYKKIDKEKENLQSFKFKKVSYESLVDDPVKFFKDICLFLSLQYDKDFHQKVETWEIRKGTNGRYKEIFNKDEQEYLISLFNADFNFSLIKTSDK